MTSSTTQSSPTARELAHRAGDGLDVTLLWYAQTDRVSVRVDDTRSGDTFEVAVHPTAALDAFEHPFAYAPAAAAESAASPPAVPQPA